MIQLLDAAGNPVNRSGVAITAALASAPSQSPGPLGGTLTVSTVSSGAAVFTNFKISKSGIYTIKFTAPGLTPVTSTAILVL